MIYTVTFNPSVDYVMRLDHFKEGGLNRTLQTEKYAGGKGINVSRVLKELQVESTALGFLGGFTGGFIREELDSRNIKHDFIEVTGDTRINVKLKTGVESEINADGPEINESAFNELEYKLMQLNSDDHVVFAGSLLAGHDDAYERLAGTLSQHGVPFSIDTEGAKLTSSLKYQPYLIKPNLYELESISGKTLDSDSSVAEAARALMQEGAENILVTMGGDGAIFVNNIYSLKIKSPAGVLVNSVGAGDSTVAGFLSRYGENTQAQLKYAIASGSATAFSSDLAMKADIEKLLDDIIIKEI